MLRLIKRFFINPCVTIDRMRAQQGAFMLFGLSRYWNVLRAVEYLEKKKIKGEEILESVNYYRLIGYGLGLKRMGNKDEYIDGISLEHIYKLYHFDTKLRKRYYGCKPEYLYSWILSLVEVRNICAHYNRLYNFPLKQCPRLFKQDKLNTIKNGLNKLFPVILVIKHITRSNEYWKQFLKDLIKLFDDNSDVIRLDFIDFPVNWKDLLKKY